MIGIELKPEHAELRETVLSKHHIFVGSAGANVIRLLPPLTVAEEQLERFARILLGC
jgi:acetylornithine aminotransferase